MKNWLRCESTYLLVSDIFPNLFNPNHMRQEEFESLKKDFKEKGLEGFPPILVSRRNSGFMIIDGEHRWRAAVELGYEKIKAEVISLTDDEAKLECFKRNYQRGRIDYFKVSDLFKYDKEKGLTIREIAGRYNLSTYTIDCILQFSKFPPETKNFIYYINDNSGSMERQVFKFTFRHLVALSKLPSDQIHLFAKSFSDRNVSGPEAEKEVALFLIRQQFLNILEDKAKRGLIFPKVAEILKSLLEKNPMIYSEEKIRILTDTDDEKRQEALAKRIFLENFGERASLYSISPMSCRQFQDKRKCFTFKCSCGRTYRVRGKIYDALEEWRSPPTKTVEIKPEHVGKKFYVNYADLVSYFE